MRERFFESVFFIFDKKIQKMTDVYMKSKQKYVSAFKIDQSKQQSFTHEKSKMLKIEKENFAITNKKQHQKIIQ